MWFHRNDDIGLSATEDKSKETVRNPPTGAQTRSAETQ